MSRPKEQTLFDLASYEIEHPPSTKRQRVIQEALKAEIEDDAISLDARLFNLERARRWIDTLIETATQ